MNNWFNRLFGKKEQPVQPTTTDTASDNPYEGFNASDVVAKMLHNIQAEWESQPFGKDKKAMDFHFHYQHGDFHVLTSDDRHQIRIHFLFFHEDKLGTLDNVRDACNQFNQRFPDFKAVYSIDAQKNCIHLHLVTSLRLTIWNKVLEQDFSNTLTLCFEAARSFRSILQEILDKDVDNLEEFKAFSQREQYLAHETEMQHQDVGWHSYDGNRLLLWDAMRMILDTTEFSFSRATLIGEGISSSDSLGKIVTDPVEIRNIDMAELLMDPDSEMPQFGRQQATIVLESIMEGRPQSFILHLSAESETDGVLYMRLTFVQPDRQLGPDHAILGRNANNQRALSFVISYARTASKDRQTEFDYLWREAMQLLAEGRELTEEQRFITVCEVPDIAYNLYWGQRLYLADRHYEAILHLENAYYLLRDGFQQMTREQRSEFFELCYYLGVCCLRLHMPHRAYYYLDGLFNRSNLRYTQAYINALTASRDYRALGIVQNVLQNLQQVYENQEADEESQRNLYNFILFLRRAMARLLIEADQLDEAEKMLKALLIDDAQHERYLLDRLAFIARLRAEAAPDPDRSTISVSAEFPKKES